MKLRSTQCSCRQSLLRTTDLDNRHQVILHPALRVLFLRSFWPLLPLFLLSCSEESEVSPQCNQACLVTDCTARVVEVCCFLIETLSNHAIFLSSICKGCSSGCDIYSCHGPTCEMCASMESCKQMLRVYPGSLGPLT